MAMLNVRVSPAGPQTIEARDAKPGDVVLAGPNRIAVMRTNHPPRNTVPPSYPFVCLGEGRTPSELAAVYPGCMLYYTNDSDLFVVTSAELIIKR